MEAGIALALVWILWTETAARVGDVEDQAPTWVALWTYPDRERCQVEAVDGNERERRNATHRVTFRCLPSDRR